MIIPTNTADVTHCNVPCVLLSLQPSNSSDDDYAKVLEYSYLFYEAQQSGVLPSWNRLLYGTTGPYGTGYRKNAHTNENVNGLSLAGGWYDAGGKGISHL
jgi:endoglucanase